MSEVRCLCAQILGDKSRFPSSACQAPWLACCYGAPQLWGAWPHPGEVGPLRTSRQGRRRKCTYNGGGVHQATNFKYQIIIYIYVNTWLLLPYIQWMQTEGSRLAVRWTCVEFLCAFLLYLLYMYTVHSNYLAPVGIKNSQAQVKWFSRYITLSREGQNSWLAGSHELLIDKFVN